MRQAMKIKKIHIFKRKDLFELIFEGKQVNPFSTGNKLQIFCTKKILKKKCELFGLFWAKKQNGWSDKLETLHEDNLDPVLKKIRKQQIYGGSRSV